MRRLLFLLVALVTGAVWSAPGLASTPTAVRSRGPASVDAVDDGLLGRSSSSSSAGVRSSRPVAIAAGGYHSCVISQSGAVRCWGANPSGQLGYGDVETRGDQPGEMGDNLPTVALGSGRTAVRIAAGLQHTCAILDNGSVKCWGLNNYGQLGYGDTEKRGDQPGEMGDNLPAVALGTGRTATEIAAGEFHTCARLDNGSVKCWGISNFGQLGYGDTATRGDGANEMGNSLPAVALGTGRSAVSIVAGGCHTCARLDNGTVKCWGDGASGELGYGDTERRGDEAGEMGDSLPAVALGTGRVAVALAAGLHFTCARLDNAALKCWGVSFFGQLGYGDILKRGDQPGEMGDGLPAVSLGSGRTATAITSGMQHSCARLDNATLKCWGGNTDGQLGYGDVLLRGAQPNQMGDNLPAVALGTGRSATAVAAGRHHTCAVLDNGTVTCWGKNSSGQLGVGDTNSRGDGPNEMGDNLTPVALGTTTVMRSFRPDAMIRTGTRPFVGNDRYNASGAKQTAKAATTTADARFTVRVQNDGSTADRIRITSTTQGRRFEVRYRLGGKDVTRAIRQGTYVTGRLAPGGRVDLVVVVQPKPSATKGSVSTTTVEVASRGDTRKVDVVTAVVTRR